MARVGRPKADLVLSDEERVQLVRWARRRKSSQALALRSRIVLESATGAANTVVAERLGVSRPTVGKWRARFLEHRLDGLVDDPRPGRPATVTAEQVEDVVVATLESTPANATHWSRSKMAERSGLSASTIGRIWKAFGLKPHRADGFKLSNDPLFVEKVYDIVGLYLDPPESAVVLSVDEKSQVQALSRSQPAFPMMPGMPEKRTHDYFRHGTTSLFAAMNIADGTVIASTHRRHRAAEFKKFLAKIDQNVPEHLDVHVICDNYGTHKHPTVNTWLAAHPRFHMHFTPTYSSWINQVERLFAEVTRDLLQRSDHRSVQALERDLREWVKAWNENPKPFIWTKTADQILESLGRLLQRINGGGHCPAPEILFLIVELGMANVGRPKASLELTDDERETLARWARQAKSSQALATRSRIVLASSEGLTNVAVAARCGVEPHTVTRWRRRFLEYRLDGLVDEPRPGRPATVTAEQVEDVVVTTLESTPANATHWSRAKMAQRTGLSKSTIGRIWKSFELKPHRADGFKLSTDPQFVEKVYDVVGLYLNPPESAVVLSVDEKSQVQALARSQPAFPMMPGMPEKRTHDYVRHGTTTLFAALNTADGSVISSLHRKHRAIEFKKFLAKIDAQVPEGLTVHLICDNYQTHKTPAINAWLEKHPRFHMHFTPTYSSWINQVERFFGFVTDDLLRRSDHRSVQALEADIRAWVTAWNKNPTPFTWTKSAEQILESLGRLLNRISGAGH